MEALHIGLMLSPQLITVLPDTDIHDALQLMQQEKASCIVVTDNRNRPQGIFTEHDLIHQMAHAEKPLHGTISRYARHAHCVPQTLHRNEAFISMSEHQVSHLAVVDRQGHLLGVVSNKDFTDYFLHLPIAISLNVEDVMSPNVCTLPAEASLQHALSLMDSAHISCIVVESDLHPVGILSERDLVELALNRKDLCRTPLQEVMHTPVLTVDGKTLILAALQRMKHQGIRRFVVVDNQQTICGLITQHDISRAIQMNYVDYLETELKRKEKDVKRIQHQLKNPDQKTLMSLLLEQTRDAIVILSAHELNIINMNQQACRQLGYEPEALIGQPLTRIFSHTGPITGHSPVSRGQQPMSLFRTDLITRSGRRYPAEVSCNTINLGDSTYLIASARDISERLRIENDLRYREETYRTVIETALDGFLILSREGRILEANQAYQSMSGYSDQELLQLSLHQLEGIRPQQETDKQLAQIIHQGQCRFQSRHLCKDNRLIDVELSCFYWQQHSGRFFVHVKNITRQKADELRLKQAAAVFENTGEAVMIVSARHKIQRVNHAFCQMTGFTEADVLGRSPVILSAGVQDRSFYRAIWHSIRTYGHWQGEIISLRADGTSYPELINISAVRDSNARIDHYVAVFADLSRQRESESRLLFLDYHDSLTGLANRKNLLSRTEHALRQSLREGSQTALIVLGLDRFKNVNDSYGHSSGDELLRLIGQALDEQTPEADTVCRLGSDEFALLFDNLHSSTELLPVANRLIKMISQPWRLSGNRTVKIGASMGISLSPQNGQDAQVLLQHADAALYQAKAEGRSRFRFFSEEMTQNARHRLELETQMHQALQKGELEVYYQPQLDIRNHKIVGAEALVRWNHPTRGQIPPGEFIPLCEENGLINGIGLTVLEQTCRQGRAWLDAGFEPIMLAVNLSAVQLGNPELYTHVTRILLETGYPAQYLELELTESALMGHPDQMLKRLQQFKEIGIRLAMDDFGTGYSSFTQLKQLPLDLLKVDKSFVDDVHHNQDDYEIVAAIIAMGQALGLKVLAEGVESHTQLDALTGLNCDRYQGYLLSRPLNARDFGRFWQTYHKTHNLHSMI